MSLVASSSSFPSRNYTFDVFASFHGPDVRKTLLSHMRKQFAYNGITMFDDQEIERSATISPSLTEAIRESRISIVVLSKKYASSSWCLDELVEILKCKELMGQIVMTIFYEVDPSHMRKQIGEFGNTFDETCAGKTDEERQKWSKALKDVGNIAGEDFLRWDNEAKMIEKIARDVSDKLNATPSRDFDGMEGLEAHLRELESLLDLDFDGVKMVAITGPAGIGKTTIARALQSRVSGRFQLTSFVDNLRGSYLSGLDELRLQEKFLSNVLNQNGIRISHSGVIKERLCKQRVLIILDDVNNIKQLMALANETTWFGPGSRIVVTTENKELLQQHGINNTYQVGFPTHEQALKILCTYAFRKNSAYHGFEELATRVTELCGYLPLALRVVGSSLREKNEKEWKYAIRRLETDIDGDIEDVLRVGYESLHDDEQSLFLHIAVFFDYTDGALVEAMFADNNNYLGIKNGLKILVNRSLIYVANGGYIVMHKLLRQVGKKAIQKQNPWKRQILVDASEICDVLERAEGTRAVSGISFDISDIGEISISKKAFKRMPNLRFLKVYKSMDRFLRVYKSKDDDGNDKMHIPEEMELPHRLRLLVWETYPSKCLPPKFHLEYLVELRLVGSKLEKLWEGAQPLTNLKKMDLSVSLQLKELPNLSNVTNLKILKLSGCESLVEIPTSFSHLHKLQVLYMGGCINLEVIPAHMNLASLGFVEIRGCSRLRNIPNISTNITQLDISETVVEEAAASIRLCSRLRYLSIVCTKNIQGITHLPTSVEYLYLSGSDFERIPVCTKALHLLHLNISRCRRLASLPELPDSLLMLRAADCESLETVFCPLNTPNAELNFTNCFKLSRQARRAIIQQSFSLEKMILPGSEMPAEFDHRAKGNSFTIILHANTSYSGFVVGVVISPNQQYKKYSNLSWRFVIAQDAVDRSGHIGIFFKFRTEHLLIFHIRFQELWRSEVSSEMMLEFSNESHEFSIIECGAKIFTDESIKRSYESGSDQLFESDTGFEPSDTFEDKKRRKLK